MSKNTPYHQDPATQMQMAAVMGLKGSPEQQEEARQFFTGKHDSQRPCVTQEVKFDVFGFMMCAMLKGVWKPRFGEAVVHMNPLTVRIDYGCEEEFNQVTAYAVSSDGDPLGIKVPQLRDEEHIEHWLRYSSLSTNPFQPFPDPDNVYYRMGEPLGVMFFTPKDEAKYFIVTEIYPEGGRLWTRDDMIKRRPEGMSEVEAFRTLEGDVGKGSYDFITAAKAIHKLHVRNATV